MSVLRFAVEQFGLAKLIIDQHPEAIACGLQLISLLVRRFTPASRRQTVVAISLIVGVGLLTAVCADAAPLPLLLGVLRQIRRVADRSSNSRCVTLSVRLKSQHSSTLKVEAALRVPGKRHPRQIYIASVPAQRLSDDVARRIHDAVIERFLPIFQQYSPGTTAGDLAINRKDLERKILFVISGRRTDRQVARGGDESRATAGPSAPTDSSAPGSSD